MLGYCPDSCNTFIYYIMIQIFMDGAFSLGKIGSVLAYLRYVLMIICCQIADIMITLYLSHQAIKLHNIYFSVQSCGRRGQRFSNRYSGGILSSVWLYSCTCHHGRHYRCVLIYFCYSDRLPCLMHIMDSSWHINSLNHDNNFYTARFSYSLIWLLRIN